MHHIATHLWFDTEAKEAARWYTSLFPQAKIISESQITGTPSGDCDIIDFELLGQPFMAISAGPYFKFTPAISLFVSFDTESAIDSVWNQLSDGGKVLMEYQKYPWAEKYGWLADRYGLSWQLSLSHDPKYIQRLTPALMFTGKNAGKAAGAIAFYTSIFPQSTSILQVHYEAGEGDNQEYLKHAQFELAGQRFIAMDSSIDHGFTFTEAISFIVSCDDQKEIDYYWEKLSAVPESEQCGWLKDKFGLSWQIVPKQMNEMMQTKDTAALRRVTQAFLHMKKFDIATLEKAYTG